MPSVKRSSRAISESENWGAEQSAQQKGNSLPLPLGVIEVIHDAPRDTFMTRRRGMLTVVPVEDCSGKQPSEKRMKFARKPITFNDDDLEGKI